MGTPELTSELLVTAAYVIGLVVADLLALWLVVKAAVRSELRAERLRETRRPAAPSEAGSSSLRELPPPMSHTAVPVSPTLVGNVMSEPVPQGPAFAIDAPLAAPERNQRVPRPFAAESAPPMAAPTTATAAPPSAVTPDLARHALEKLAAAPPSPHSAASAGPATPHARTRGRHES